MDCEQTESGVDNRFPDRSVSSARSPVSNVRHVRCNVSLSTQVEFRPDGMVDVAQRALLLSSSSSLACHLKRLFMIQFWPSEPSQRRSTGSVTSRGSGFDRHRPELTCRMAPLCGRQTKRVSVSPPDLVSVFVPLREKKNAYLRVVSPGLVAGHAVAADELDGAVAAGGVQTVVVRHDLLAFRVRKHLVAAETVAVRNAQTLAALAAHRVQTRLRLRVANLPANAGRGQCT